MPFSRENRHLTISLVSIIAGLFVIAIGAQAYLAQQDNRERDAAAAAQDRADRAYADCLTEWSADFVATVETRSAASIRLDEAEEEKSRALDRLLRITELARRTPPEATATEFDLALAARVEAQSRYDRVKEQLDTVRAENEYVSPKVACSR